MIATSIKIIFEVNELIRRRSKDFCLKESLGISIKYIKYQLINIKENLLTLKV